MRGEATRDEVTRGEATRDEVTRGEVTRDEVTRDLLWDKNKHVYLLSLFFGQAKESGTD